MLVLQAYATTHNPLRIKRRGGVGWEGLAVDKLSSLVLCYGSLQKTRKLG